MKKFLSIIFAVALVMSLSIPAFAANETGAQTDLTFTYSPASPTYTVTIPASLTLALGDTNLPITVSDTTNLNGGKISVTFEGTQTTSYDGYSLELYPNGISGGTQINYYLYDANGVMLPENGMMGARLAGETLAQFTADGTKNLKLYIAPNCVTALDFQPGVPYTGYITFGIALV